ncbi:hypothetical protein FE156_27435 [Streptomyces albidoflavus]|uniref:Uncharacterized protein n=1 Tax=Streptomyces odorifer TaxID=53450 RepID=A0A7Y6F3Y5_9ACTN|nr:hypothetical protein WQ59_04275 [Streptomyces sp. KE1]NUV31424.1 hypothetical protein [Streptomyces odorifer]NUV34655.1 hypothetical protein [Streptomyces sp. KAI-27]NUV47057.1 hypothetical protein [Streptomyces sp. CAI-78]QDD61703.1 hypothetical protein FE156_27435 [Streptomyces albidoflavus]
MDEPHIKLSTQPGMVHYLAAPQQVLTFFTLVRRRVLMSIVVCLSSVAPRVSPHHGARGGPVHGARDDAAPAQLARS